jgi:hypothetical protein
MNARSLDFSFGALAARADRADTDRWARIRAVAAAISDADLDDETDVVRALYASRFSNRDFGDILNEAIDLARQARR